MSSGRKGALSGCWDAYETYGEVRVLPCPSFTSSVSYSRCYAFSTSHSLVPWRGFQTTWLTFLQVSVRRCWDLERSDFRDRLVKLSHLCPPLGFKSIGSIQDMFPGTRTILSHRAADSTFAFVAPVSLQQPPGVARPRPSLLLHALLVPSPRVLFVLNTAPSTLVVLGCNS